MKENLLKFFVIFTGHITAEEMLVNILFAVTPILLNTSAGAEAGVGLEAKADQYKIFH